MGYRCGSVGEIDLNSLARVNPLVLILTSPAAISRLYRSKSAPIRVRPRTKASRLPTCRSFAVKSGPFASRTHEKPAQPVNLRIWKSLKALDGVSHTVQSTQRYIHTAFLV